MMARGAVRGIIVKHSVDMAEYIIAFGCLVFFSISFSFIFILYNSLLRTAVSSALPRWTRLFLVPWAQRRDGFAVVETTINTVTGASRG
jgi:hypothetical protein